jgi:hypothetical protein
MLFFVSEQGSSSSIPAAEEEFFGTRGDRIRFDAQTKSRASRKKSKTRESSKKLEKRLLFYTEFMRFVAYVMSGEEFKQKKYFTNYIEG